MPIIEPSECIDGVQIVRLRRYGDERGAFVETFRKSWFPQRSWDIIQFNRSESRAGTLRGLHYHHRQVDYWHVIRGRLHAALVDLRPSSPTYLATQTVPLDGDEPGGLFIPVGVGHGFLALTDVTLTYVVDNYYDDGRDELGVAWNDPALGVNWGGAPTFVSPRDAANPAWAAVPTADRPR